MPKTVTKAGSSSRSSYQKGYQLGNRGSSTPAAAGGTAAVKDAGDGSAAIPARGGRGGPKGAIDKPGGMNISFGDTLPVGDLKTIADFGKQTKASKPLKPLAAKGYAKSQGDSGSGFNVGKRR